MVKVQQPLVISTEQDLLEYLEEHYRQTYLYEEDNEMLTIDKIRHLKSRLVFFLALV